VTTLRAGQNPARDATLRKIIAELNAAAAQHDAGQDDRLDRLRLLEPDAGEFLWFLAQSAGGVEHARRGRLRGSGGRGRGGDRREV
jgi:hypothetical protein